MSDILVKHELSEIISRLRWLEGRDGSVCFETRYVAMCRALGLLNRACNRERFTNTRKALFAVMNEAKVNMGVVG